MTCCEVCQNSNVPSLRKGDCTENSLYEEDYVITGSYAASDDDLSAPRIDENTRQYEEANSDIESQPENVWQSDSISGSNASDMRSEVEIDDDEDERINVSLESDVHLAKCFLERNWRFPCDCEDEAEENEAKHTGTENNEPPLHGLLGMVNYWQSFAVPDSIGRTSSHAEIDESNHRQLDWYSILSGGDNRPKLDIQLSERSSPEVQRTWDVDSIISWATCLSVNRGLYISYHSPPTRNLASNLHVFHQGTPYHIL
ncbi:hypothetical protein SNK04_013703 [Fusarium graminearum]